MKSILFSIMLFFSTLCSYGQLDVTSSKLSPIPAGGGVWYNPNPNEIGYVLILSTDNKYDDPLGIVLGSNKENALKTLDDLISICNKPTGTNTSFDSGFGYTVTLDIFSMLGKKCSMSANGYAGIVFVNAKLFEGCKKKVIKFKEP